MILNGVMILDGALLVACMTTCKMEPPWPTACRLRLLSLTCFCMASHHVPRVYASLLPISVSFAVFIFRELSSAQR